MLEWLKKEGKLGEHDELSKDLQPGQVGTIFIERIRQKYKGVPVYDSSLVVLRRGDKLIELGGVLAINMNLSVTPTISIEEALARAQALGDFEDLAIPQTEQLYVHYRDGETTLVWRLESGGLADKQDVLINAHDGSLVRVVFKGPL